jgi:lysophospholipase L1-like esterase
VRSPRQALLRGAVVASIVLAAGCSSGDAEPREAASRPPASPAVVTPTSTPPAGAYPTYVALADSVTAAPLATETENSYGCLRSSENYPTLVAALLDSDLDDRSCAGADTSSLVGVQETTKGAVPPQFEALDEDTTLVTVGIGGNDFKLFATLVGTCPSLRGQDPTGSPCRDQFTDGGRDLLLEAVDKIQARLVSTVTGIRDRSPNAEVVVVGYPAAITADDTCPDLLPLAEGDQAYAAGINEALAKAQQEAAAETHAIYVDTYAASTGHDICSDDPWVNGQVTSADTALAYHPLAIEQQVVAALVVESLPTHR